MADSRKTTDPNKSVNAPVPERTGCEDHAQLAALGRYFERVARGEIPAKPATLPPPTFTWGFRPEERARLERERAAREQAAKNGPKPQ